MDIQTNKKNQKDIFRGVKPILPGFIQAGFSFKLRSSFLIEQDVILIKKACYGVKQSAICKKVLRNGKIY